MVHGHHHEHHHVRQGDFILANKVARDDAAPAAPEPTQASVENASEQPTEEYPKAGASELNLNAKEASPTQGSMPGSATDSAPSVQTGSSSSGGLNDGAKAGIAVGVILGVGLIVALVFLWMRMKKQSKAPASDNEKFISDSSAASPTPVQEKALPAPPRPSRAGVPDPNSVNVNGAHVDAHNASRESVASESSVGSTTISRNLTGNEPPPYSPPHIQAEIDKKENPFSDPTNPFGNQAEAPVPPEAERTFISPVPPMSPMFSEFPLLESGTVAEAENPVSAVEDVNGVDKTKKQEYRTSPSSVDNDARSLTAVANYNADATSMSEKSATAAAIGPGPSNVHRVQMDFTPSMEDELELRVGQLVRVLHEYDDGWVCFFHPLMQVHFH